MAILLISCATYICMFFAPLLHAESFTVRAAEQESTHSITLSRKQRSNTAFRTVETTFSEDSLSKYFEIKRGFSEPTYVTIALFPEAHTVAYDVEVLSKSERRILRENGLTSQQLFSFAARDAIRLNIRAARAQVPFRMLIQMSEVVPLRASDASQKLVAYDTSTDAFDYDSNPVREGLRDIPGTESGAKRVALHHDKAPDSKARFLSLEGLLNNQEDEDAYLLTNQLPENSHLSIWLESPGASIQVREQDSGKILLEHGETQGGSRYDIVAQGRLSMIVRARDLSTPTSYYTLRLWSHPPDSSHSGDAPQRNDGIMPQIPSSRTSETHREAVIYGRVGAEDTADIFLWRPEGDTQLFLTPLSLAGEPERVTLELMDATAQVTLERRTPKATPLELRPPHIHSIARKPLAVKVSSVKPTSYAIAIDEYAVPAFPEQRLRFPKGASILNEIKESE